MKYYKDNQGGVYAFSDIQIPAAGLIAMTPEEIEAHLNPPAQVIIPEQISLAQGHHILIVKGKYQQVLDYIDAIPDQIQKLLAENAFYRTNPWNRQSPFLNQAATDLDFIDDLDDWFIEASKVII